MLPATHIKQHLHCWIPVKLIDRDNGLLCNWRYTKDIAFTDPFFDETIVRCLRLPENSHRQKCLATLEMLDEWAPHIDAVYPTAFIFHVSRCGSTLVSQALSMNNENISLSEVPIFDELLRLPGSGHNISDEQAGRLLCNAIKFYGAKRTGSEKRLFIKTDSWHLLYYRQLRRLYPDTPFIIMYREPAGVLESNRRKKGLQGIPELVGPDVYGFTDEMMKENSHPDRYMELVLERFFGCIADAKANDPQTLLVNYKEGLPAMMRKIAAFAGMTMSEEEEGMIIDRSLYSAKFPGEKFTEMNKNDTPLYNGILTELYNKIENWSA